MNFEKLGKLRDMNQFFEKGVVSPASRQSAFASFEFMNHQG